MVVGGGSGRVVSVSHAGGRSVLGVLGSRRRWCHPGNQVDTKFLYCYRASMMTWLRLRLAVSSICCMRRASNAKAEKLMPLTCALVVIWLRPRFADFSSCIGCARQAKADDAPYLRLYSDLVEAVFGMFSGGVCVQNEPMSTPLTCAFMVIWLRPRLLDLRSCRVHAWQAKVDPSAPPW